ncbi:MULTISPECIES: DNA adenine methylase [unclassified Rhizobium]|uniref:DNA adenine methylase n=1 Tax=unclassified Rhizobium TaxID=2613769 RepID=UPI001ADB5DE5|nr:MULTISPECIES: DNA adenine methylase [unclassified Rhizobium]MBO9125435.1 DNA adenine methylase [Rhizobium sp. 16-488-2b]MBO9176020.1 DNA adenine methylase [Rhizobium sp. 16-488-2a]
MTNHSPLRYPGGKGKLAPYVSEILRQNDLEGGHYAEPFAGGAAVALDLLFSERVKHIHINDLDWTVYSFWKAIIDHTEDFVSLIERTEITVDEWMNAREVKRAARSHAVLEVGFSTFFLNRTNRSGILNGGMIGGIAQDGAWKLDCRFNKADLIQRIRRIGMFRSRITLTNLDASDFLTNHIPSIAPRSLIYIDPPYYVKGASLYQNHFNHQDHVDLAGVVKAIDRHAWFVSYDNVEQIRRIYRDCDQEQFGIGYSARNHSKGSEVMVFGNGLRRPPNVFVSKTEQRAILRAAAYG